MTVFEDAMHRLTEKDAARSEAIGWLVSSIDDSLPGFVNAQAARAEGLSPGANVLRDWGKRLGKPRPRFRSRKAVAKAVVKALTSIGFEKVMPDIGDEPTVSVRIGKDRWVDVFVREAAR